MSLIVAAPAPASPEPRQSADLVADLAEHFAAAILAEGRSRRPLRPQYVVELRDGTSTAVRASTPQAARDQAVALFGADLVRGVTIDGVSRRQGSRN